MLHRNTQDLYISACFLPKCNIFTLGIFDLICLFWNGAKNIYIYIQIHLSRLDLRKHIFRSFPPPGEDSETIMTQLWNFKSHFCFFYLPQSDFNCVLLLMRNTTHQSLMAQIHRYSSCPLRFSHLMETGAVERRDGSSTTSHQEVRGTLCTLTDMPFFTQKALLLSVSCKSRFSHNCVFQSLFDLQTLYFDHWPVLFFFFVPTPPLSRVQ